MHRLFLTVSLVLAACSQSTPPPETSEPAPAPDASEPTAAATPALSSLWVLDGFEAPEGVAAAPQGGYFISNVAGEGADKDAKGWISHISEDGELITLKHIDGLNAPKGMAILDGTLYVADIDTVRLFEAETGDALGTISIDGAGFLNDMTVWNGNVLVADSANARIHLIDGDAAPVWLEDETALAGVNGLLGDGDRLLVSTMSAGNLLSINQNKDIQQVATGMANADGIGQLVDGGYLVSSWPGQIHYVAEDGDTTTLLDTTEDNTFQNDLTVFSDIVIVPNWQPGTVSAWRVTSD